jgi:hydrogenase-4 component B
MDGAALLPIDVISASWRSGLRSALPGCCARMRCSSWRACCFPLGAFAALVLAAAAAAAIGVGTQTAVLPIGLPGLPFHLRLDPLASFFLFLLGAAGAGVSAFAAGYFRHGEGTPPGLMCLQYHVFLVGMAMVLLADDAYAFMVTGSSWRSPRSSSSPPTIASPRSGAPATCTSCSPTSTRSR